MDLKVGFGALLARREIDLCAFVLLAALFEHDMRRHRARAGTVIKRQHSRNLPQIFRRMKPERDRRARAHVTLSKASRGVGRGVERTTPSCVSRMCGRWPAPDD